MKLYKLVRNGVIIDSTLLEKEDANVHFSTFQEGDTVTVEDTESNAYKAEHYADLRRTAYPPITDYLDGVAKANAEQINKYIADCLAVKAKYPKP